MKVKNTNQLNVRKNGTGADLVLLNGWGLNCGIFDEFASILGESKQVALLDLPGYGVNNDCMPENYCLEEVASMVADVIGRGTVLVGWSLGGLVAQKVALMYPQKVAKLCLIATSPKFVADPVSQWSGIEASVMGAFKKQLRGGYKKTRDKFIAIQAMGSATAHTDIAHIKDTVSKYPDPHPQALEMGLEILCQEDLRQSLLSITQPTLRVYGKFDSLIPQAAIEMIKALQPHSTTLVLDQCSHAPFISHPQQFLEHLLAFIAESPE